MNAVVNMFAEYVKSSLFFFFFFWPDCVFTSQLSCCEIAHSFGLCGHMQILVGKQALCTRLRSMKHATKTLPCPEQEVLMNANTWA